MAAYWQRGSEVKNLHFENNIVHFWGAPITQTIHTSSGAIIEFKRSVEIMALDVPKDH